MHKTHAHTPRTPPPTTTFSRRRSNPNPYDKGCAANCLRFVSEPTPRSQVCLYEASFDDTLLEGGEEVGGGEDGDGEDGGRGLVSSIRASRLGRATSEGIEMDFHRGLDVEVAGLGETDGARAAPAYDGGGGAGADGYGVYIAVGAGGDLEAPTSRTLDGRGEVPVEGE